MLKKAIEKHSFCKTMCQLEGLARCFEDFKVLLPCCSDRPDITLMWYFLFPSLKRCLRVGDSSRSGISMTIHQNFCLKGLIKLENVLDCGLKL